VVVPQQWGVSTTWKCAIDGVLFSVVLTKQAGVAPLGEDHAANGGVVGSNPITRSLFFSASGMIEVGRRAAGLSLLLVAGAFRRN
jgi:hypothetical protein